MSIKAADVIKTIRGLITEDNAQFFANTFLVYAINAAQNFAFGFCYDAREDVFKQSTTITIDSAAVTAGTLDYDLPDGTVYVSDYCVSSRFAGTRHDYRPRFINGSTETPYIAEIHYTLTESKFRLLSAPTQTGTIKIWYKVHPAAIVKPTAVMTTWPNFFFNYFVEYVKWFCERKDENEMPGTIPQIQRELMQARGILTGMLGKTRRMGPDWSMVNEYEDL